MQQNQRIAMLKECIKSTLGEELNQISETADTIEIYTNVWRLDFWKVNAIDHLTNTGLEAIWKDGGGLCLTLNKEYYNESDNQSK